jgi:hypothetical protein
MAAPSLLDPGVGEALGPGVAEVSVGDAVGTEEGVGESAGEDGDVPPQAASTSRKAASTVTRRFIAGILARYARMAVS